MTITTLSLTITTGVTLYSQISTYQQALLDDVSMFSEFIGRSAVNALLAI
jgi:hypothetical protein